MLSLSGGEICGVCIGMQQDKLLGGWGYWVVELSYTNKPGGILFVT